jgi:hypothetical protein
MIGKITNIGLTNVSIHSEASSGGTIRVAGYAIKAYLGSVGGNITNSFITGNLTCTQLDDNGDCDVASFISTAEPSNPSKIENVYSNASLSSSAGLNAYAGGIVSNCDNHTFIINNAYFSGTITGERVGGILGRELRCNVTNSFFAGNITATQEQGGIAVWNGGGNIVNSYWYNRTGNPDECYDGGETGCVAIDDDIDYFYNVSNAPMDEWDFTNVWSDYNDGSELPIFQWQAAEKEPVTQVAYTCGNTKLQYRISNLTEQDVEPVGQNASCPAYNVSNSGVANGTNITARLDGALPSGIEMWCNSSDMSFSEETETPSLSCNYYSCSNSGGSCSDYSDAVCSDSEGYTDSFGNGDWVEVRFSGTISESDPVVSSVTSSSLSWDSGNNFCDGGDSYIKMGPSRSIRATDPDGCWDDSPGAGCDYCAVIINNLVQVSDIEISGTTVNVYVRWEEHGSGSERWEIKDTSLYLSFVTAETEINLTLTPQLIYENTIEPNEGVGIWCNLDLDNPTSGRLGQVLFDIQ